MKRLLMFFTFIMLLAVLTINLPFITGAAAQEQEQVDVYDRQKELVKSVVFKLDVDQYYVNGQTPGVKMDARPFAEQGRTFVPVRFLGNALGVTDEYIGWESPRVTLDEPGFPVVELAVGGKQLKSDGAITNMDVAPLAKQGRTYLPARWVAEALGYQVEWDAQNSVVLCWPRGAEKPDIGNVLEHIVSADKPAAGTKVINGYIVPLETDLKVEENLSGGCEIDILMDIYKPLEPQFRDAYNILASKLGHETAETVINYVRPKKDRWDDVPQKMFNLNDREIMADGSKGDSDIYIVVWK